MRNESNSAVLSRKPALVVTYGNTNRKLRPLDRDVVVLGRARNCDVALVSPDVAPVHCLVARVAGGWRLRDCTGRGGTRVNGQAVTDVLLTDGDVLQVGNFSFEVRLPPQARHSRGLGAAALARIQRSRRALGRRAVELRRRLKLAEDGLRSQEELDQQADRVRTLQRDAEARRKQHEQAEAALRQERAAFEKEQAARRRQLDETEARLRAERTELDRRLAAVPVAVAVPAPAPEPVREGPPPAALQELERRGEELNAFARHLARCRERLNEQTEEFSRERECSRQGQTPAPAADAGESARLRGQVADLEGQVGELKARAEAQEAELRTLRALEDAQAAVVELSGAAEMHTLIASLRAQVRERDGLLEQTQRRLEERSARPGADDAGFEAELNHYRRELESDRQELNEQIAQMRERHAAMEEAAREAEVQMSRERAQIAREQAELNRLRQELGRSNNRSPQEHNLRERLAGVMRLKEDLTDHTPGGAALQGAEAARPRWRSLLGRSGEATP
jgi:pSer/pThr/pTyr-binding forkhead associated (FHA) protein